MIKALFLVTVITFSLSTSAFAKSWSCTCRDSEGNDVGGVTVTTGNNGSWDEAVRKANNQCRQDYSNSVGGANCDSND